MNTYNITMEELIFSPTEPTNRSVNIYNSNENNIDDDDIINYHKLYDKWCLWAHLPHNTDWSIDSYKKIITFSTLEEAIILFDAMPDMLIKNCMLFLMKDGIAPTWEDQKNKYGGCFSYKIPNKIVVDAWKNLSYTLISYTLSINKDFENSITGITISPKKNFCIVKIWLTNCNFKDATLITDIDNLSNDDCIFKKHK